ncbi:MAG: hypothetical protein AAGF49_09885 [Pseudomonadota bacterium]
MDVTPTVETAMAVLDTIEAHDDCGEACNPPVPADCRGSNAPCGPLALAIAAAPLGTPSAALSVGLAITPAPMTGVAPAAETPPPR